MTKVQYQTAHRELAEQYSKGIISFEGFKEKVKALNDHEHEYEADRSGERVCWCGAVQ